MARHLRAVAVLALVLSGVLGEVSAQAAGEPVNREAPKVTLDGGTLRTSDGVWVGRTQPYAYAWFRCDGLPLSTCAQVPGQVGPTYALGPADGGKRIRSRVTAANQVGSSSAFSAATAVVARTRPAPGSTGPAPRLSPFPVLVVAGRTSGSRTRVTDLTVRGERGALVSITCRGRGCPLARVRATIGARKKLRLRSAQRVYRAGQVLELRVTRRGKVGKFTRLRFRRGRPPARSDSCLQPGATKPSTCLTT